MLNLNTIDQVPFYLDSIFSSVFNIIYNTSPNLIFLYVLGLVLVIILLCTEEGSSVNQAHKQDHTVKVPGLAQRDPPVADLTYVNKRAPRTGRIKRVLINLNDSEGVNLENSGLKFCSSEQVSWLIMSNEKD